ncbi:MAG: hypothetical protein ACOY5Y_20615 [Pseudomonadota bacterium]|jgi:hypothetical protein
MRLALIAIAGAVAAWAPPAVAQTPADRGDVRCLLVLQAVGRDPNQRDQAVQGIYYFLGKLNARGGLTRVEPLVLSEARSLTAQQAQSELARCGGELNKQNGDLQAMNQRLQAAAGAAAPAKK